MAEKKKNASTDDAKELGISPGIVASGEMFKEGLLWGGLATAASWAILVLGRREGNVINTVAEFIEKWHGEIKGKIGEAVQWVGKKVFHKEITGEQAIAPAITATSFIIGGIAGKIALPSAAIHGANRAKQAIAKYSAVKAENRDLQKKNALLSEDVAALNEALAKADASGTSFVKRTQTPEPEETLSAAR